VRLSREEKMEVMQPCRFSRNGDGRSTTRPRPSQACLPLVPLTERIFSTELRARARTPGTHIVPDQGSLPGTPQPPHHNSSFLLGVEQ